VTKRSHLKRPNSQGALLRYTTTVVLDGKNVVANVIITEKRHYIG
jgi:hypothetical protein